MKRLEGRVAIVTGASRGIGRSAALAFAREGAKVVVAAKSTRSRESLPGSIYSVAEEIEAAGGEALPIRLDVRNDDDIEAMTAVVLQRLGRIDVLVNNAGALWWRDVAETPMKKFDLVQGVNIRGAFACTRACLGPMIEQGWGHVVMVSPSIDLLALPGRAAYLVGKFGMTMLAMGLAEELKGKGVAANALWPATAIESAATKNFGIGAPSSWRKPEIMADALVEITTTPPADLTGRALIDEDFLRERGWTDFTRYRCDPRHEPPRLSLRDLRLTQPCGQE